MEKKGEGKGKKSAQKKGWKGEEGDLSFSGELARNLSGAMMWFSPPPPFHGPPPPKKVSWMESSTRARERGRWVGEMGAISAATGAHPFPRSSVCLFPPVFPSHASQFDPFPRTIDGLKVFTPQAISHTASLLEGGRSVGLQSGRREVRKGSGRQGAFVLITFPRGNAASFSGTHFVWCRLRGLFSF